jgi:uncharacterized protein YceK
VRRASRIGAVVVAGALAATSGCASAIATPRHPVPYAGAQSDLFAFGSHLGSGDLAYTLLAIVPLVDLVPSFAVDTALLPITVPWSVHAEKWDALEGELP